jgi:serine/threonine protein kinase
MIRNIEFVHERGFVHRDIKPENMCVGNGKKQNICYLIDFGLVKRYLCPKTGEHIRYQQDKGIVGTVKFLSLTAHNGDEHGRRDDVEAITLIIVYLYSQGKLPWDLP